MLAIQLNTTIILKSQQEATNFNLETKTEQTDIEIIEDVLSGSQNAFKTLYTKHARNHFLTCLRYIKNRSIAEDLLQESYFNIFKNLKQFKPEKAKFSTWSNKVVVNTCLMHLRKKNVFSKTDDVDAVDATSYNLIRQATAFEQLSLKEITEQIQSLPKGYRTVFNLFVIDGYSHNEIAEMLKISVSTSKTQLLKAKKALQSILLTRGNSQSAN